MGRYWITWNSTKTEGVIVHEDDMDSAYHAGGGCPINPVSSIADNFRETYGDGEDSCFIQLIEINNADAATVDKW